MSLSCGIVGLPNVGKSTLFNALTKSQVESQNYPFTTIDPNIGIVDVPDARLKKIAELVHPQRIVPSTVQFVDIAGLVKGAAQGEGLGNQFLSHIRELEAIVQIVRVFDNPDIIHVQGRVDPLEDFQTITTELILKDLETLEKFHQKAVKNTKLTKDQKAELPFLEKCIEALNRGEMLRDFVSQEETQYFFFRETRPLTLKPMLVAANMDEQTVGHAKSHPEFQKLKTALATQNIHVIPFCATLELEILHLSEEEKSEMMEMYEIEEMGLTSIIREGYDLLNYISYFTAGEKEVRSWAIERGNKAPEAAGVIHSDFQKGFIRAEVIHYEDFVSFGGEKGAKEKGKVQVEGKEYTVQDGDIMLFRFNN